MTESDKKIIVNQVLNELKSKNLFNTSKNSYTSTEKILYSFSALPVALNLINEEISKLQKELKDIKVQNVKSSTLVLNELEGSYTYGNETLETRISELKQIAAKTRSQIRIVNKALDMIKSEKYYKIIELYYFEGNTIPVVAEKLNVSTGTISDNKNKLINKLKVYIFPETFMKEL